MAVRFGVAIGAEIGKRSVFDRKNYFYPDSAQGLSGHTAGFPTVGKGALTVTLSDGSEKVIGVTRRTSKRTPASLCMKNFTACPESILIVPESLCLRSFQSPR